MRDADPGDNQDVEDITVLLVDDHELLRRGLRNLLELEPDLTIIGEAGTAAEALDVVARSQPDVALLDLRLPDGDGIEVCREIRSRHPDVACVVLTSYSDDEAVYAAIMAGAAGFLLKDIPGEDLVAGIRRVAAGDSLLDPGVTTRVLDRLRTGADVDERKSLTDQERTILVLIADGLTNRQIGERLGLGEKPIRNSVSTLMTKLGVKRRSEAAALEARRAQQPDRPWLSP